ncbi:hypothetical protein LX32DRAFT_419373 [Colletotrichum zoysiae]|uniref:Secreted protein n=1 Tax=Colletotrichum zoysiae TaxID=1216348 RepID=A0AAD9HUU0_9PEZI|nr:hypothetical protein LX32DRAFT_419373 [Colletotrichum zoysiae]
MWRAQQQGSIKHLSCFLFVFFSWFPPLGSDDGVQCPKLTKVIHTHTREPMFHRQGSGGTYILYLIFLSSGTRVPLSASRISTLLGMAVIGLERVPLVK